MVASDARGGINSSSSTSSQRDDDGVRLYNPFQEYRGTTFDPRSVNTLYRLPSSPEFLFPEEAAVHHRNWSENLTYYTGCGYLGGALLGGGLGVGDGIRASEEGDTLKLRINRVLNASGHRGRAYGNKLGVIGLMYAGLESGITAARGTDDILNSIAAGLGTGALFRVAAGPRAAAFAGALGGIAAGVAVGGKHALRRYSPI